MLLDLRPKQSSLLILPHQKQTQLLVAIAHQAQSSPLIVIDCGRQYDPSVVARAAQGRVEIIDRIKTQRAFTCYEVVKLLERTPVGKGPIIILGFLSTFCDENVKFSARKFLLESSLCHFQRLSLSAGLVVSTCTPPASEDIYLFERLRSAASNILTVEPSSLPASQLRLF